MEKILIVDDELHVLSALRRVLNRHFDVLIASSGEEALATLETTSVAAVISDYMMPKMLGVALLSKVEAEWPDTVRIIISGYADYNNVMEAMDAGVVHKFLAKPWDNDALIEHITTAICQSKKHFNRYDPVPTLTKANPASSSSQPPYLLEAILSNIKDAILTVSTEGLVLAANDAAEQMFGYPEQELIANSFESLLTHYYREDYTELLASISGMNPDSRSATSKKLIALKKSGEVFPIELSLSSCLDGGEVRTLCMVHDLTEQVKTDSENKQFLDALESCQEGFALFSPGGRLLRCNHQFKQIYKRCTVGAVEGVKYVDFLFDCINSGLFPAGRDNPHEWVGQFMEDRSALLFNNEYEVEEGRWIKISETITEHDRVISFHMDITEQKQTELSLVQAVKDVNEASNARSRFFAMMSHELRTPLNGVIGLLDVLHGTELSEKQLKYVSTAAASGKALLAIISDILDFSKLEAHKLELKPITCNLRNLVNEISDLFHPRIEEKSITLDIKTDPTVPNTVKVDAYRLRQVLLNLVSNAVKFTHKGQVVISIESGSDAQVLFKVSDTGVGIPEDEKSKIFSEFCTIRNQESPTRNEGTGLGLAISHSLVGLLGGELCFKSSEEVGTEFWFTLKLPVVTGQPSDQVLAKQIKPNKLSGKVLLVDDSETNRLVARSMLETYGIEIVSAESGEEAIELCKAASFDVILMDISMPGLDGLETTQILRTLPHLDDVPVVALTAYALPEDEAYFLTQGMSDYLEKPIDKQKLFNMLCRYLEGDVVVESIEAEPQFERLFDKERLSQLGHDTSFEILPHLVSVFTQDAQERLAELQQAQYANLDIKVVARHLHTLGSSSALYGLHTFHQEARRLEGLSKTTAEEVMLALPNFVLMAEASLKELTEYMLTANFSN